MTHQKMFMDPALKIPVKADELSAQSKEILELASLRFNTAIESLDQAQRFYANASNLYHDAIVVLSEDPDDDFETAFEKSKKLSDIESNFENAIARLNFELRQAKKQGITQIGTK